MEEVWGIVDCRSERLRDPRGLGRHVFKGYLCSTFLCERNCTLHVDVLGLVCAVFTTLHAIFFCNHKKPA
jgi:hypothetical protein